MRAGGKDAKIMSTKIIALFMSFFLFISVVPAMAADDSITSTADFSYRSFAPVKGLVKMTFAVTANTVSDGIIGLTASNISPKDYSDYAICFRIRAGAFFDSNNASGFDKVETVSYRAGEAYNIEIEADTQNQIYNAYVVIDGARHTIAENYAFRTYASDFGKITVRGGGGVKAGLYSVSGFAAVSEEGSLRPFSLPNYYAENMVFQREKPHVVFGTAADGVGDIEVTLSNGEISETVSAKISDGRFEARLDPLPASLEPYTLTVSSKNLTRTISPVYVGDVFLLAGQSNMAQSYNFQTTEQLGGGVTMSNLPERVSDERVKHFTLSQTAASYETFDVPFKNGSWQPLTEDNNKTLSYIGMFFAKERLEAEPDVPVGLMSVAWNGTTINRWMRKSDDNKTANYTPTNGDIFNNHIAPFVGFNIKAVLWYQGESDSASPQMYSEAFPQLIRDWRSLWNDDLPFLFVQLARFSNDNYAPLRRAQLSALELDNVGMAVILDTDKGTADNIHPLGKEAVAHRLFLLSEKYAYGKDIAAEGPIFESAEANDGSVIVHFKKDTLSGGLAVQNTYGASDTELCEFELAAEDGGFKKARAVINPDNTVTVTSEDVPRPAYVRYAYSAVPENPNLFNSAGLPASPFTTDSRIVSANSFTMHKTDIENAPVQTVHFKTTAFSDNIDGVILLSDFNNTVSSWNHPGITVRYGTNGFLEYRDGGSFKTSKISYKSGDVFKFDIVVDFTDKTYSAVVNGAVLCCGAAFRTGSLSMSNAGSVVVRGGDKAPAEQFAVWDYSVSNPSPSSFIRASDGENAVYFVVSPGGRVRAASYSKDSLTNIISAPPETGVAIITLPLAEKDKIFIWDESLKPLN